MPFCFFESTVSTWPIVMPSLRGGSHSLMMVLSEHLDLFTPLAGSRLIGRVDWESIDFLGFSYIDDFFFVEKVFETLVMHVLSGTFLNLMIRVYTYLSFMTVFEKPHS